MKNIIEAKNLVKTFGKGSSTNNVLDHVDVAIREGEFVAVMGPSGCGKTTLLFALSGTDEITEGSVVFGGRELLALRETQLADFRLTKMGFVFQQPTMLKNLNILDNILLPSMHQNRREVSSITDKAKKLMQKTGIADLGQRDIAEVSGGQLQRAGICRALMGSPDILFADEPTGALNSKSAEEIMELLCCIHREGTAIFMVTHDVKVAAKADRVLFMKDGQIKSELRFNTDAFGGAEQRTEQVLSQMRVVDI